MNYDVVSLGDVCDFLDNQRVPITESDRKPGPYPYYGANGQQDSIDNYIFDEPLVLLAEDGGYFGSKDRPIAYKVTGKCWVNNHAHVLRPKSDIDVDYLHRVLSYYDVTKYVNGTTRQKLTKGNAENISFPLPPLTEQKRIASLLARADRLRQLRRTAHDLGESLLQSVFLEMFGDSVTNSKKFDIESLEDVLASSPQNGLYVPEEQYEPKDSKSGVEMVHMSDAFYGKVERGSIKRVRIPESDIQKYSITHNDLLIARRSLNFEGAAKPCLIPEADEPLVFESSMIRVTADQTKLLPIYLYYYLSNERAKQAHVLKYVTKSTISGINQDGLKQIEIILPPLSLQEEFAGVVARVESLRGRMSEAERQVNGLFESLLAESFGG